MADNFSIQITNLSKLQDAFGKAPELAREEFSKGINVVIANILKRATDEDGSSLFNFKTPRIKRTGMLSLSFGYGIGLASSNNLVGSIGPTV